MAAASPAASVRKGGPRVDVRSKAKVKSENNRSLRKMKKNRSIVRQMLFPNSNPINGNPNAAAPSSSSAAAATTVAAAVVSVASQSPSAAAAKSKLDEANVNGDHQGGLTLEFELLYRLCRGILGLLDW